MCGYRRHAPYRWKAPVLACEVPLALFCPSAHLESGGTARADTHSLARTHTPLTHSCLSRWLAHTRSHTPVRPSVHPQTPTPTPTSRHPSTAMSPAAAHDSLAAARWWASRFGMPPLAWEEWPAKAGPVLLLHRATTHTLTLTRPGPDTGCARRTLPSPGLATPLPSTRTRPPAPALCLPCCSGNCLYPRAPYQTGQTTQRPTAGRAPGGRRDSCGPPNNRRLLHPPSAAFLHRRLRPDGELAAQSPEGPCRVSKRRQLRRGRHLGCHFMA